ncbi:MAG: hypothetical protein LBU77_01970 [Clostridiales bacterium]|jgi:hypothetical protein|nr:hypothetical protein [Clostridiales bacterium]
MAGHRKRVPNMRKRNRVIEVKQSRIAGNEVKYEVFLSNMTKVTITTSNQKIAKTMIASVRRGVVHTSPSPTSKPPLLPIKPKNNPSTQPAETETPAVHPSE